MFINKKLVLTVQNIRAKLPFVLNPNSLKTP
jgi:hypothetical protein